MVLGGSSLAKVGSVPHHVFDVVVVIVLRCVVLCCVGVLHGDFPQSQVELGVGGMADS